MPVGPARGKTFRKHALDEIKKVKWDPAWGEERIGNMIESRPDWTISRQRIWGVPIAIFVCTQCNKALNDPQINRRVVELFASKGADAWYLPEADSLADGAKCPCGGTSFQREADILDVLGEHYPQLPNLPEPRGRTTETNTRSQPALGRRDRQF